MNLKTPQITCRYCRFDMPSDDEWGAHVSCIRELNRRIDGGVCVICYKEKAYYTSGKCRAHADTDVYLGYFCNVEERL